MIPSEEQADIELRRQQALVAIEVLDTQPEPVFDAITQAAAQACCAPIALVSLSDTHRQWFKSNIGLPGVAQAPRDIAFCDHAIRADDLFEVPDALADGRFSGNPWVTGDPWIRFYAGAPIVMPTGERIGTVCVIDREPRQLDAGQRAMLASLGRIASAALHERRRQIEANRELALSEAHYRVIVEDQSELVSLANADGTLSFVNAAYARHYGLQADRLVGRSLLDFVAEADRPAVAAHLQAVAATGLLSGGINRTRSAAGDARWVSWINRPVPTAAGTSPLIHSVGRDITDQRLAELRMQAALRDKETLLKEVYHRVKNNLQIVQSLLSLQQHGTGDAAARLALAESARRVRAMALVHEQLYQSGDLALISLQAYTRKLLGQIDEAAGATSRGIELVARICELRSNLDGAIPFGLLVTELVSNALEHGFEAAQPGRICVELALNDDMPELAVTDDGVGLRPGFVLDGRSMGLQLAASLAQQLGGELSAENKQGAIFRARLPRLKVPQGDAPDQVAG
jgi:PAS domain S-box-containing protein